MANGRCKRVFRKFCTYIHLLLIFVGGGRGVLGKLCVFLRFLWLLFCFGEFVSVFVFAFGGDRESDEEVRFLQFLLFFFFPLGFLGGVCFDGLHKSPGDE